ncbi:NADP-dependent oxidoreductase [Galbibacter mesophilus]|uniref:NADP-dependent oxidoreductase n=1 Tax=Galbibacter mesophilus TaxID=379069 RepID=UPI00191F2BD2|nr:NADP-dependent oxidoreductase [Galbibacter mesophilus]MCM5663089.1 NADP-dependent oxidoreductase [Galbibacter mesophilus]
MSNTILLNNRPKGKPSENDFKFVDESIEDLKDGGVKVSLKYVSVDPYLRGRMRDEKSYIPPFELGKPITSTVVAEILESKNDNFSKGDFITGMLPWKKEQIVSSEQLKQLRKVESNQVALSAYLGLLGMTGLTAYFGLTDIGKPQKGEIIVVSGAAGAVGSVVGQIAKIHGLKVIGIAGTDEKIEMLKNDFGFDDGINYNTTENMKSALKELCPDGIDIYFDNVGGDISDAVLFHIKKFARIINCGAISVYNETSLPKSISVQPFLIKNSALMQGFIVGNYQERFSEGIKKLSQWLSEGKLKHEETIVEGFENIPQAFIDLFDGKNKGKMVVKV